MQPIRRMTVVGTLMIGLGVLFTNPEQAFSRLLEDGGGTTPVPQPRQQWMNYDGDRYHIHYDAAGNSSYYLHLGGNDVAHHVPVHFHDNGRPYVHINQVDVPLDHHYPTSPRDARLLQAAGGGEAIVRNHSLNLHLSGTDFQMVGNEKGISLLHNGHDYGFRLQTEDYQPSTDSPHYISSRIVAPAWNLPGAEVHPKVADYSNYPGDQIPGHPERSGDVPTLVLLRNWAGYHGVTEVSSHDEDGRLHETGFNTMRHIPTLSNFTTNFVTTSPNGDLAPSMPPNRPTRPERFE